MPDTSVAKFLADRRKFIAGTLAILSVLVSGQLVPGQAGLIVQALIGFLGAYGIHEVANGQSAGTHRA